MMLEHIWINNFESLIYFKKPRLSSPDMHKTGKTGRTSRTRFPAASSTPSLSIKTERKTSFELEKSKNSKSSNTSPYDPHMNPFSELYCPTNKTNPITSTNPFLQQPTPTNPISQKLQDQQNQQNNPVSISASAFQQQPFQEQSTPAAEPAKANFSDDLLNFGNELSFGQNVMNNISQNSAPLQQVSQNSFDPFGMAPGSQNTVPSASNPFNMTASSPMMMGQPQQQQMGGGNPFGNPFAGKSNKKLVWNVLSLYDSK